MGKIGDLIVRLKLQYQDYEKGLKKAGKETKGFSAGLGKIKAAGVAVWAAIGASVIQLGKDLVKSANQMEDKWAMFTSKAKAGWTSFVRTLANGDWNNFLRDYKKSVEAAEILTEALDASTEVENSIRLKKAKIAEELAQLSIDMRDQTKSDAERVSAAQEYLRKMDPIYQQEIDRLKELRDARVGLLSQGAYDFKGMSEKEKDNFSEAVYKFLELYGETTKYDELGGLTLGEAMSIAKVPVNYQNQYTDKAIQAQQMKDKLFALSEKLFPNVDSGFLFNIGHNYENKQNGEEIQELVNILAQLEEAQGLRLSENTKIYTLINSLKKKMGGDGGVEQPAAREFGAMIEKLPSITAPAMSMEVPDILPDDWLERNREKIDAALAEAERLAGITDEINRSFESAIVSSVSGATQALTDCIAGIEGADATRVLAALMQPFADTMIQLGEMLIAEGLAISAFKESLKSLNPYVALAAGAALLAVGAALSSGIQKLGATAGSGATTTSTSASSSASGIQNVQSELTIYVKGSLKGSDIVLSGQRTLNSWAR